MIYQSFKMAWKSIVTNKMRSFLTMLGIIIGVFALVVLVSLATSATSEITDSINSLGSNLLYVTVSDDKGKPVKLKDLQELAEDDAIRYAAPVTSTSMTINLSDADEDETANVYGTTGDYFAIENLDVAAGRLLKSVDVENHSMVAVLGNSTATELLGSVDVVGRTIRLNGTSYQIVGVLGEQENNMSSLLGDSYEIYIPYTTLIRMGTAIPTSVTTFYASSADEDSMDAAENAVSEWLMDRFESDEDAFTLINQSSIMDVLDSVMGTMTLLLGGIAGISLLVGGIGIMNIMLVSVTERTKEIGIRKAIGATRRTIMLQFLLEASVISLMGCVIGIFFSAVAMQLINRIGNVSYGLNPAVVAFAIAFSMAVGLIFGLYPANKAAKKNPIEALRYIG